jgi:anti-sigma B factor antagonist
MAILTTSPQFKITATCRAGWLVVAMSGDLDIAAAPTAEATINGAISHNNATHVALELGNLDFCDSTGLGLFVKVYKLLQRQPCGQLRLLRPPGHLRQMLHRTGLDRILPIGTDLTSDPRAHQAEHN